MVSVKATHTGTCRGCGRRYTLNTAGEVRWHQIRQDVRLPSGTLSAWAACIGAHKQPKRGTRRPT